MSEFTEYFDGANETYVPDLYTAREVDPNDSLGDNRGEEELPVYNTPEGRYDPREQTSTSRDDDDDDKKGHKKR